MTFLFNGFQKLFELGDFLIFQLKFLVKLVIVVCLELFSLILESCYIFEVFIFQIFVSILCCINLFLDCFPNLISEFDNGLIEFGNRLGGFGVRLNFRFEFGFQVF